MTNDSTMTDPRRDSLSAVAKPARTSSSDCRSRHTPRPWLPSRGLTTTGKPTLRAAATAASAVRTVSCLGTGRPAEASRRVVMSLSLAMSTARAPVLEVIVARIRCAWTPWPSWTSEAVLSRM